MPSPLRLALVAVLLASLLPLAACLPDKHKRVRGYAVKGPFALALVSVYAVDPGAPDLKGELLDTGDTDEAALTSRLTIPRTTQGPILLEFTAGPETLDLSTGAPPLFPTLRTLVDAQRVIAGDTLFATPLTTLAVEVAGLDADRDGDGSVTGAELDAALDDAAARVASTLGFGLLDGLDLFDTPALITADTATPEAQEAVLRYRMASEALAAVVLALDDAAGGADPDAIVAGLAEDLSDDVLDGLREGAPVAAFAGVPDPVAIVTQDPAGLMIPGTAAPLAELATLLAAETADTGVGTPTEELGSGSLTPAPAPAMASADMDLDGVVNALDTCPDLPNPAQQPALWGGFAWGGDCWQ